MSLVNPGVGSPDIPDSPDVLPTSPTPSSPPQFPSCSRIHPLNPFAARWRAKREDHDRFVEAINGVNARFPDWRLPDALAGDWLASWVNDLFRGVIPRHDRLTPQEVAAAVEDVAALAEALRFVERQRWLAGVQRVWFYELPGDLGLGRFPTLDEVRRHRPEWDIRRGLDDQAGDIALSTRYDQAQFLDAAAFLLGTPTEEQQAWLRRLAYRPDPLQPLWDNPPRHHTWARNEIRQAIPELAGCLGVEWPEIAAALPIPELIRRAHNWVVQCARPELIRRGWSIAAAIVDSEPSHAGSAMNPQHATDATVASPAGGDLITAVANQLAESDRRRQEEEVAFEAEVAGPARGLRPEWDAAWGALWSSLANVCSRWERPHGAEELLTGGEADPVAVASALKRVGRVIIQFEQIARARFEINPTQHDLSLLGRGLPLFPLARLDYVANDHVIRGNAPKLAAALVRLSTSGEEAVLTERVRTLLADERLRPTFGWLLFIRDCLWAHPPHTEPVDPVGPGDECPDWSLRIYVDDYRRAGWLLRGEIPYGCDELFPESSYSHRSRCQGITEESAADEQGTLPDVAESCVLSGPTRSQARTGGYLPAPSGVAVLREHIRGLHADLFLVGYRDRSSGRPCSLLSFARCICPHLGSLA